MSKKALIRIITVSVALVVIASLITVLILYLRPIKEIKITNDGVQYAEISGRYVVLHLGDSEKVSYQIEYEVSPSFLKSRDVVFEYKAREGVTVSDKGLVEFTAESYVDVKILPKNGRGDAVDEIRIIAKP
jgi:hypothetical protein